MLNNVGLVGLIPLVLISLILIAAVYGILSYVKRRKSNDISRW